MCLGLPGKILSVSGDVAVMESWGTCKNVRLGEDLVLPGDYVIEHCGIVVRRIPPAEVEDTFALYETILAETLVPA